MFIVLGISFQYYGIYFVFEVEKSCEYAKLKTFYPMRELLSKYKMPILDYSVSSKNLGFKAGIMFIVIIEVRYISSLYVWFQYLMSYNCTPPVLICQPYSVML